MKTMPPKPTPIRQTGFSLIEMIGVLAIMGILAAVITPNALRSLDRAAVRAEASLLRDLGDQTKSFLKAKGWAPGLKPTAPFPTWYQDIGTFADISPADILTNKRQINRSFIYEPIVPPAVVPMRALVLSSMRNDPLLTLPTAANLNTMALFDNVWNTTDGSVPPAGTSWNGWAAWRNTLNGTAGDYLVISRVNLASIYNTELQSLTITLHNKGTTTVSYNIVGQSSIDISPAAAPVRVKCRPKDQLNLYRAAGGATLDYSYVVPTGSSGRTFDFTNATNWTPQP